MQGHTKQKDNVKKIHKKTQKEFVLKTKAPSQLVEETLIIKISQPLISFLKWYRKRIIGHIEEQEHVSRDKP